MCNRNVWHHIKFSCTYECYHGNFFLPSSFLRPYICDHIRTENFPCSSPHRFHFYLKKLLTSFLSFFDPYIVFQTYYNNQHWTEDKEVYCSSHVPKIGPGHLDNSSVGIRSALNVPRSNNYVNEQIRGYARNSHEAERKGLSLP